MKAYITLMILTLVISSCFCFADSVVQVKGNCKSGLQKIKQSPFSFYFSCEDALGNYVGIILTDKWSTAGSKFWKIGDRFWYESSWGDDVDSFFVVPDKQIVYIATSSIYGIGGIYKLLLKEKKSQLVFPKSKKSIVSEMEYSILSYEKESLKIKETNPDGKVLRHTLKLK